MKLHPLILLAIALTTMLFSGCDKSYEEFYFTGHPVGAEMCSATQMGYLIEVDYPKGLGDTISVYGGHFDNAVMGYRSPRLLKDGDVIYGVAYLHKSFAALNCVGLYNYSVPEIVLISVDEDSATVMNHLLSSQEEN